MIKNNFVLLVFSFILALIFLLTPVYSATYIDNGVWKQYTAGLDSSFYSNDLFQDVYNRAFDDVVSSTTTGTSYDYQLTTRGGQSHVYGSFPVCNNNWCVAKAVGETGNYQASSSLTIQTTGADFVSSPYSLLITKSSRSNVTQIEKHVVFSENEISSNSLIRFKYKLAGISGDAVVWAGSTSVGQNLDRKIQLSNNANWTQTEFISSSGSSKFGIEFYRYAGASDEIILYIDDVEVINNNVGTFRSSSIPNNCTSLKSCSNIETHLPSNNLDNLYWVVDYVAGATCSYSVDGVLKGAMSEGLNGLYYALINESVSSGHSRDLNLSASCLKSPYAQKDFFVSPKIYKYGLVDNGDFENDFNSFALSSSPVCNNDWCAVVSGGSNHFLTTSHNDVRLTNYSTRLGYSTNNFYSNKNILEGHFYSSASSYITIWNETENQGGAEIEFSQFLQSRNENWASATTGAYFSWGYINDSNVFTAVGTTSNADISLWTIKNYEIPVGSNRLAFRFGNSSANQRYINAGITSITSSNVKQESSLTATNTLIGNAGQVGDLVTFYSDYKDISGNPILNADCNILLGSLPLSVSYNSILKKYQAQYGFISSGNYQVVHACSSDDYNPKSTSYSINIGLPVEDILTFTPISNISNYDIVSNKLRFGISNNSADIVFKVLANDTLDQLPFYFYNSSSDIGKNYFVYVSDDGINWAFDTTLTFGQTLGDLLPIQKIWEIDKYKYEFYVDLLEGNEKYYKLVYQDVGKSWETIGSSSDWVHINNPTNYFKDGHNYDVFSVSELSQMYSRLKRTFSQLLSGDFVRGVYVQYTAYSSDPITLKVGMWDGDNNYSVGDVNIDQTPKRISVLLNPFLSEEDILLLFSQTTSNASVYITDYHLVPSSYFVDGLQVLNSNGSALNSIFRVTGSHQYIREGEPFRIKTSAYDQEGDLDRLEIRVYADIGSDILIGTNSYDLTKATKRGKYFSWDVIVNGVVDLNGNYVNPDQLRNVYIQARLYNTANLSVGQLSRTIKLLQYPHFQNDLKLSLFNLNSKFGENPKFRIKLENAVPSAFVGLRFIFHKAGIMNAPYYEKTIYASELNCNSLIACEKELSFNEYTYNILDDVDYLSVEILVNTEYPFSSGLSDFSGANPLTLKQFPLFISYREFDTARIFQVFERQYNTYRPDEKIAFVLQLRDLPYRDLSGEFSVYATIRACDSETGGACSIIEQKFLSKSHKFDATTGYNYFYWNNYFFNDSGELLDQNWIELNVHLWDNSYSHEIEELPIVGHANKCQNASYGTFFNWAGFNMNFLYNLWTANQRLAYGCTDLTDPIVRVTDVQSQRIFLDSNHATIGGQNHSIACLNTTQSKDYVSSLNQEMLCMVLYKQGDETIDTFRFYIANEFSDFSRKIDAEKQYIELEIPADQIIYEDVHIMAKTLESEFQVDTIDTIGELAFYGFDKLFSGINNPITSILEGTTKTGLITNIGFDVNWDNAFNPNYVTGIFFISIKDLRVINQQDYIRQYPVLEGQDASHFMRWANQERVNIPVKKAKINILGSDLKPLLFFNPNSQIVINTIAQDQARVQDVNNLNVFLPNLLKFNFISDMISNNWTRNERLFVPVTFTYLIPPSPFNPITFTQDLLFGENNQGLPIGLFNSPVGFVNHNWFWLFILGCVLLVGSLIYKNLKSGGSDVSIYNQLPKGR